LTRRPNYYKSSCIDLFPLDWLKCTIIIYPAIQ
jgi:hypothetical protein